MKDNIEFFTSEIYKAYILHEYQNELIKRMRDISYKGFIKSKYSEVKPIKYKKVKND